MIHKINRIQTEQGSEISMLIGQYIDIANKHEEIGQSLVPFQSVNHQSILNNCSKDVGTTAF
jgi:hypothetical protein